MKTYRVEYEDDEMEIITAESDEDAWDEALKGEEEHGTIFNICEIDESYNVVRQVY